MSLPGPGSPRWAPTHVQVTVLQAQGLRPKAKGGGGSDAYALMALGKDKFATSVAERCLGRPVWREEATFELAARRGGGGAPGPVLQLTVLHRALVGLDKFLGRADVPLEPLLHDGGRRHTRSVRGVGGRGARGPRPGDASSLVSLFSLPGRSPPLFRALSLPCRWVTSCFCFPVLPPPPPPPGSVSSPPGGREARGAWGGGCWGARWRGG